jgi:hypothetical protein
MSQDGRHYGHGMWVIYDQQKGFALKEFATVERERAINLDFFVFVSIFLS